MIKPLRDEITGIRAKGIPLSKRKITEEELDEFMMGDEYEE